MNVKNIVKVMNFHALIHVDRSKRAAIKFMTMDEHLLFMMDQILNNKNLQIDQGLPAVDPSKPKLIFFIGSDYGFCSNYNSRINECLIRYEDCEKVLIGKKLSRKSERVLLRTDQEQFSSSKTKIQDILINGLKEGTYSEIALIYNKYINVAQIDLVYQKLFPIDIPKNKDHTAYQDDYVIEGDSSNLWKNLVLTFLMQEIELATISGYAAENVLRQNTTRESLKKIDEIEEVKKLEESKERRQKEFAKLIDNFTHSASRKG